MIITSYYTGRYEKNARRLQESCEEFHCPYHICRYKSEEYWWLNVLNKGRHLLNMLELYPTVCWIDADSWLVDYPGVLVGADPVSFRYRNLFKREELGGGDPLDQLPRDPEGRPLAVYTGVMVFQRCPEVIDLLTEWNQRCMDGKIHCTHFRKWTAWEPEIHMSALLNQSTMGVKTITEEQVWHEGSVPVEQRSTPPRGTVVVVGDIRTEQSGRHRKPTPSIGKPVLPPLVSQHTWMV